MPELSPSFDLSAGAIQAALDPSVPLLPELEAARANPGALAASPQAQKTLAWTEDHMARLAEIPQTRYTDFRAFIRTGDRRAYETPYFARRAMLAGAALRYFLGQDALKDLLQDLIWAICEETTWVLPAHERTAIDLFSAESAFMLAETLALLGDRLDAEVRSRVRAEVEARIFRPYLTHYSSYHWYTQEMNWNGVCNSSVAAAFLLLEPEPARAAQALEIALRGLRAFISGAFEADGSSNEGVSYWHYGLINFVALAEMLYVRSRGKIDLLAGEHMKAVAAYPAKMMLSPGRFVTFSDCDEALNFNPGIISRLAERTGEPSLRSLLSPPVPSERQWRLTMMLRDLLWWDGSYREELPSEDACLPALGAARLVARTPDGRANVVAAIKAGHNDENHNQNDVGSFILHVDDETFLVDPGRGLYSRQYFGPQRYENIFANSYGHSVPVIGGKLQHEGREYRGELLAFASEGPEKRVEIEFARAYPVEGLESLRRRLTLTAQGEMLLEDAIRFSGTPLPVEEAFLTWNDVEIVEGAAVLHGARHDVRLSILAPQDARFAVERLEQACRENLKPGVLKRLTVQLSPAPESTLRLLAEVIR